MRKLAARHWKPLVTLLAAAVLAAGWLVYRHKTAPYHFLVVEPGVLYRSGWLSPDNFEAVLERHGIRTVLNVSEEREKRKPHWYYEDEVRICAERGVRLVEMPIDSGVPPTPAEVDAFLAILDDPDRLPALVHCDHGVMRTGMLVAVYEMEERGKTGAEALRDMPMFGHTMDGEHKRPMRRFILDYVPRSKRAAPGGGSGG
jgi:protein tyrosine/serine phosphatase